MSCTLEEQDGSLHEQALTHLKALAPQNILKTFITVLIYHCKNVFVIREIIQYLDQQIPFPCAEKQVITFSPIWVLPEYFHAFLHYIDLFFPHALAYLLAYSLKCLKCVKLHATPFTIA